MFDLKTILKIAILLCLLPVSASAGSRNILILHSSLSTLEWSEAFNLGFQEGLSGSTLAAAKTACLYFDPDHIETLHPVNQLAEELKSGQRYDLIVAADNLAMSVVEHYLAPYIGKTPVLFCDLLKSPPNDSVIPGKITLQQENLALETVRAAVRMFPNRRRLLVLCGGKDTASATLLGNTRAGLDSLSDRLETEYVDEIRFEDLLAKVAGIKDDGMVLYLGFRMDSTGMKFSAPQVLKALSQSARVPVFAILHDYIGKGIIGGKLSNGEELGGAAAELAIRLADRQLDPVSRQTYMFPGTFEFDWNVIRRFGLSESDLSERGVMINQPERSYFRLLLWSSGILVITLLQTLFIVAMIYARRRERETGKQLRKREREWRSLTENLPDIIFRINRSGHYSYINQAIERTLKIKAEDMIGKTSPLLKLPSGAESSGRNDFLEVFRDGVMKTREDVFTTANGNLIMESRLVPERNDTGEIENILCISRDVTAQRAAEKELTMRQFIIENSMLSILILRINGTVYFHNDAAARLLGIPGNRLRNMNFVDLRFEKNRRNFPSLLQKVKSGGLSRTESAYTDEHGRSIPVEFVFNHFSLGGDEFVFSFLQDVTERRNYEAELEKAKEKAEQSDRLKSTFLANMSHEVRTPLNGILGFADLLKYSAPDDCEREKYIDIIHDSGNTLLKIIDDILDISKIESGQIKIHRTRFQLAKLIRELHAMFRHQLISGGKNVELRLELPPDMEGYIIFSDEIRLRQILNNLIGNALKFTREGFVEIGYRVARDKIVIHVKDTGIGIPQDKLEAVFQPFRQAEDTISRSYGGTGLGLAIAQSYARLLQGGITVESEPGVGSSFFVTLPVIRSSHVAEEEPSTPQEQKFEWLGKKILIVEDDETSFIFMNKILSPARAEIIHAENGISTIQALNRHPDLNLVLMDLKLPDANGIELTTHIKAVYPGLPVIIQTADVLSHSRDVSNNCGCDGFLTKPVNKDELLRLIDSFIGVEPVASGGRDDN